MSTKGGSVEEEENILEHEVKGLRLQIAAKQEILERLIDEIDNLYTLLENMRENEREKDLRIKTLEKELQLITSSRERGPNTGNRSSELSPSCKITQFASNHR